MHTFTLRNLGAPALLLALRATTADAGNAVTSPASVDAASCAALNAAPAINTVSIPAGIYRPFFKSAQSSKQGAVPTIAVPAFRMDAAAVTRGEYLRFLCSSPSWRKSNVTPLFAEERYLADWPSDLDPGNQSLDQPVTYVSWFAARAYCAFRKARLPTVVEWERVAGATESLDSPQQSPNPAGRGTPFRFAMGTAVSDLRQAGLSFAGVWEWNADFNSVAGGNANSSNVAGSSLFCGDGFRSNNASDYAAFLRYSFRSSLRANYTLKNLGFRCVQELAR